MGGFDQVRVALNLNRLTVYGVAELLAIEKLCLMTRIIMDRHDLLN
jgi:hypothetical protein